MDLDYISIYCGRAELLLLLFVCVCVRVGLVVTTVVVYTPSPLSVITLHFYEDISENVMV